MKNLFVCVAVTMFLATSAVAGSMNIGEQISNGGAAIIIILVLSIIAFAVSIERAVHLRKKYLAPVEILAQVKTLWREKKISELEASLSNNYSVLARILHHMVKHRSRDRAFVSIGTGDIASIEMRYHQQKAYPLAIVATVAPLVGLLGTVIGMIEAFHVIAFSEGMGHPELLAGGISKALVNTASGLAVALPALAMHHFYKSRLMFFSLILEKSVNELMDEWFLPTELDNHPPR
jgi:biopolymer transport protein ExbB